MKTLFPHEHIRPVQKELMRDIEEALAGKMNLLAHAPTGLGKTASALSVAVPFALDKGYTVFFLTNRHTQHAIAVDTLRAMRNKHGVSFMAADIIGKKAMCMQDGVDGLLHNEFTEYCKAVRENGSCEHYAELYHKFGVPSVRAQKLLGDIARKGPMRVDDVREACASEKLCAYYFSSEIAKNAEVIIADYNNVFNPSVQTHFFARTLKELEKSIVIVDEAHNLPERIRSSMSMRLSSFAVTSATQEARRFGSPELERALARLRDALDSLANQRELVERGEFIDKVTEITEYDALCDELITLGDEIREAQKRSFVGSVGEFLSVWKEEHEGFVRYIERKRKDIVSLHLSCLDASLVSSQIFQKIAAGVLMSGTLTPLPMYRDILGIPRSMEREYPSPFPKENRLALVVPETSTQFRLRNDAMYSRIASICKDILDSVRGNSAFFFSSYEVLNRILERIDSANKRIIVEKADMPAHEKWAMLEEFKMSKETGAALFAVASANFSEGIDLPGDYLRAVVVVGLPLARPDVKVRALIKYYEKRFNQGWEYGYVYPAMTKCLQAAGRCIRSEKDRGMVVFLDQRFIWAQYYKCLPSTWDIAVTRNYRDRIATFFDGSAN